MAIVDKIRAETIELLRGKVDFYLLRGRLPVARKWPKKPTPPYTALQAEAMLVFKIASACLSRISNNMLAEWRKNTTGVRPQWTDIFKGIIMSYWKVNRSIPLIAIDYEIIETLTEFRVIWNVLQVYIDPDKEEEEYQIQTDLILKADILKANKPIYFTLYNDEGKRLVAPYILFEIKEE